MSLKEQKCRGNLPGWRQYGILMALFWTCTLKKRGQVFTRVGLLVNLYYVWYRQSYRWSKKKIDLFRQILTCCSRGTRQNFSGWKAEMSCDMSHVQHVMPHVKHVPELVQKIDQLQKLQCFRTLKLLVDFSFGGDGFLGLGCTLHGQGGKTYLH